jgi:hypothetical protein
MKTEYIVGGGLAAVIVGYLLYTHTAKAAVPPAATTLALKAPALPPQQAWSDYTTLSPVLPGFLMPAVNLQTGATRNFTDQDSIVISKLENQSLTAAGIKGKVFYANDGGISTRYWSP